MVNDAEIKKIAFSVHPIDLSIIDAHNTELANPGRSAALRHIIREWAESRPVKVPIVGRIENGRVILDDAGKELVGTDTKYE